MIILRIIFLCTIAVLSIKAQTRAELTFIDKLAAQQKLSDDCPQTGGPAAKPRIRISGCEWNSTGCPLSLVRPSYPGMARHYRISGSVVIEAFVDDSGKVAFAKAVRGNNLLIPVSLLAAARSLFVPVQVCGKTGIQRQFITYNFVL